MSTKKTVLFLVMLVMGTSFMVPLQAVENKLQEKMIYKLPSGDLMPLIGFGTYQIKGTDLIRDVLDYALGAGYRLIDTAKVYNNEEDIGKALKELLPKYNLSRQDIWITTKLSPDDQGEKAYQALKESVRKLDCDYVDLYLIHWPGTHGVNASNATNSFLRDQSWKSMTKGVKDGLAKNIGVSNYLVRHLQELLKNDHGIKPVVNQVEWHPHYQPQDLFNYCKKEVILLQAYSSLGGTGNSDLLNDSRVKEIATKLGKTPAQVLLKWPLQQNIAIIPKARSKKRIEENFHLNFTIPEEDMLKLSQFENKKYSWNPETIA